MATVHLIEGPVGAGKSTFALRLSLTHRAPTMLLDDWMARLFRPDRPTEDLWSWYQERKGRCIEQIWVQATELLELGSDVVLELGLVQASARDDFYARADAEDRSLRIYVLDAPEEVRRARVQRRNLERGATFSMEVPDEVFTLASAAWEAPDERECAERGIEFPMTPSA